jgi:hypothetical protein
MNTLQPRFGIVDQSDDDLMVRLCSIMDLWSVNVGRRFMVRLWISQKLEMIDAVSLLLPSWRSINQNHIFNAWNQLIDWDD